MQKLADFFHHLFIPHEDNNFRAKSLHPDFLMMYLVFALVLTFAVNKSGINVLGVATDITVQKLFQLTNDERQKNNLPALSYSDCLSKAAYNKAEDMFSKEYWAHFAPDGTTPWDFMLGEGCKYEYAGENLAKNFMFSDGVVTAWMNSPTHKENIVNKNYTEVGYAVVNGVLNGEPTTLVVQMFDKPLNPVIAKEPFVKPPPVLAKEPATSNLKKTAMKAQPKAGLDLSNLPLNINVLFICFLLFALALDFYFAAKLNIIRVGGKNLAHFIFVLFLLLGLIYINKGSII